MTSNEEIFTNINIPSKQIRLKQVNDLFNFNYNKIIFIYTQPKVGSTSLVSSLRIFGINKFHIIHIHDEVMLKVLKEIDDVTINEIIAYNKYIGKEVYVIDIYRSPIERKISAYFEKIGCYHFNNIDNNVNKYNINRVINRFNKIMPYIANGDHFLDIYPLTNKPEKFDFDKKYLLVEDFGIKYIKLRLKDSNQWGSILSKLLHTSIHIVRDYETSSKPIKDLYKRFKENYKIPKNLLDDIMNDKYLNYYYNNGELNEYFNLWKNKSTIDFVSFTEDEYKLYEYLCLENNHLDYIQLNHYIDEGCICKACNIKRNNVADKIKFGIYNNEKIIHEEAKKELLTNRVIKANRINTTIHNLSMKIKGGRKDFKTEMKSIVSNKRY
jgi:hypothetical protein